MEKLLHAKLIVFLLCINFAQVGCGGGKNLAEAPSVPNDSGAASSGSSSSGESYTKIEPLDAFEGLLPRTFGGRSQGQWGEDIWGGKYSIVYAAINTGSDKGVPVEQLHPEHTGGGFIADQYFVGGKAVDRNDLADQQEAILHESSYRGTIYPPSRSARTGEFTYEIEVPERSVALEIHVVPLQLEPYTDIPFSITIENMPVIESLFTPSSRVPLDLIQGFTFEDVEVEDGSLTLTFVIPEDYFGVSAIFVSDVWPD